MWWTGWLLAYLTDGTSDLSIWTNCLPQFHISFHDLIGSADALTGWFAGPHIQTESWAVWADLWAARSLHGWPQCQNPCMQLAGRCRQLISVIVSANFLLHFSFHDSTQVTNYRNMGSVGIPLFFFFKVKLLFIMFDIYLGMIHQ